MKLTEGAFNAIKLARDVVTYGVQGGQARNFPRAWGKFCESSGPRRNRVVLQVLESNNQLLLIKAAINVSELIAALQFYADNVLVVAQSGKMITRYLTEVSTVFNPFSPRAKTARLFLSFLPGNARATMKVDTKILPRTSRERSFVQVKFSTSRLGRLPRQEEASDYRSLYIWISANTLPTEDGKEMKLDSEQLGIKGVIEEVDRHSRILARQDELNGN
jgi:large subunit ribosomal protein L53